MKVNDLIQKLNEIQSIYGNVDVEYDINSALDSNTEIESVNYDDNDDMIYLSAY